VDARAPGTQGVGTRLVARSMRCAGGMCALARAHTKGDGPRLPGVAWPAVLSTAGVACFINFSFFFVGWWSGRVGPMMQGHVSA
jgi:hypothetical protein